MMKKLSKESFTIKGTPCEAFLKGEIAKLFCHSLERKPDDKDIQAAIVKTLGRDSRDKHKFDTALKYCKSKLTEFRTEERRKVLGTNPCYKTCLMNTRDLSVNIMKQMCVADDTDTELYLRHLVLFQKFVREVDEEFSVNYTTFHEWVGVNFSEISEEVWEQLLEDDEQYSYDVQGEVVTEYPYINNSIEIGSSSVNGD